jgi:diguanylate cyclase (GGDEF)-like protein
MAEMARRTHPADRGVASGLMLQALGAPGGLFAGTYRFRGDQGWVRVTAEVVNLIDNPHVEALLGAATIEVLGPVTPSAFAPWDRPVDARTGANETVLLPYDLPLDVTAVAVEAAPLDAPVSSAAGGILAPVVTVLAFTANDDGRIVSQAGDWRDLQGGDVDVARLQDIVHPGDRNRLDGILQLLHDRAPATRQFEVRGRTGRRLLSMNLASAVDDTGYRGYTGTVADITMAVARQRRNDADYLTGLLNHDAIERRLAAALDSEDRGVMLLLLDLDGFHHVNDDHGRDSGDVVLAAVAKRLRMAVRTTDEVGRFGGDQFAIVCRDAGAAEDDTLVHRLAEAFKHPVAFATGTWRPAASIGIARYRDGDDVNSLLRRATDALDDAKRVERGIAGDNIRSLVG